MNKITSFLLLIVGVLIMGTVSSCKDTNEDLYNDLNSKLIGQNSTLRELLDAQKKDLEGQISTLKDQLAAIKSCTCDPAVVQALRNDLNALQTALNGVVASSATNASDIATLNTLTGKLEDRIKTLENRKGCECDLTAIQQDLAALKAALNNKADKTALEAVQNSLNTNVSNLIGRVAALETAKTTIEGNISTLEGTVNTIQQTLNGQVTNIEQSVVDIQTNITRIEADCQTVASNLQSQIIALENKLNSIKDYDDNELRGLITGLQNQINGIVIPPATPAYDDSELRTLITNLQTQINSITIPPSYNDSEIRTLITNLQTEVNNIQNYDDNELRTLITNLQTQINGITIPPAYNDSELRGLIAGLQTQINSIPGYNDSEIRTLITNLQAQIDGINIPAYNDSELRGLIADLQSQITNLNIPSYDDSELRGLIANLQSQIGSIVVESYDDSELRGLISGVQGQISSLSTTVSNLNTTVSTLELTVSNLSSRMTQVEGKAADALSKAEFLETWINNMKVLYGDNLEALVNVINGGDLDKVLKEAKAYAEACKAEAESVSKEYTATVKNELAAMVDNIDSKVVTLDTKVGTVEEAYKAADEAIKEQIVIYEVKVTTLENSVDALEAQLVSQLLGLKEAVNKIVNRLNSQITSMVVQSITTPLFLDANIALPMNVQSNIVCAYYGEVQNGKTWFPSSSKSFNLSDEDEMLTDDEVMDVVGFNPTGLPQGTPLVSNGGKIYLTINPSTVNFTGAGLKLVDSQNGNSGFEIQNVKKSDKLLSFVSRSSENGFYEADFKLVDKNKAEFNTAPLKDAAKEVYSLLKTRTGIRDMAKAVVTAAYKSVSLPAYAIQAPYTWTNENGQVVTSYVHSNYNIAATAIHPLTYNFSGKLGNYTSKIPQKLIRHIPYLSEKFIESGAWKNIKTKLHFEFDKVNYLAEIKISVKDIKFNSEVLLFEVEYQEPVAVDPVTGAVTSYKTETVEVKITDKEARNMIERINAALEEDMIKKANGRINKVQIDFVDAVNSALKSTEDVINTRGDEIVEIIENFAVKSDKYVDKVNKLIDKVNYQLNKVYNRLDDVDHYLLPIMFYSNAQGRLNYMSSYEGLASYVTPGYMVLYPTSYTVEILNPAAKKMVKVTKAKKLSTGVNDAAEVKAANDSFADLNKVLDGSVRAVGVKLKSGYAYEFAYSALDYTGYQVTQRYWVKVK